MGLVFYYMHKDIKCAKVTITLDSVLVENYTECILDRPFGINTMVTVDDAYALLEDRCFPRSRFNFKEVLNSLGLRRYNSIDIINKTHGVLCQDFYWILFEGETLTWNDVKLANR